MSETSPTEKTVVVKNSHSGLLWTLTIASLALNVLILLSLVCVLHHRHHRHGFGGRDGRGGHGGSFCRMDSRGGFGGRFHRFGGGFGPMGMNGRPGPGMGGMRGMMNGGKGGPGLGGMRGMMGGGKNGPPDPAKMTDGVLNFLTAKLTLTDDQKAKLKPIIEQQVAEIQKEKEAERAAMQKRIEDAKAKIKPLLNADQQKQLDALQVPGQKGPPDQANDETPGQ